LKLGIQLEAKAYAFEGNTPEGDENTSASNTPAPQAVQVNGHAKNGKKKKGKDQSSAASSVASDPPLPQTTFGARDILNISPVVKDASPKVYSSTYNLLAIEFS